jgi:hypothetical protein
MSPSSPRRMAFTITVRDLPKKTMFLRNSCPVDRSDALECSCLLGNVDELRYSVLVCCVSLSRDVIASTDDNVAAVNHSEYAANHGPMLSLADKFEWCRHRNLAGHFYSARWQTRCVQTTLSLVDKFLANASPQNVQYLLLALYWRSSKAVPSAYRQEIVFQKLYLT